jgi:hypothetical protein
VKHTLCRRSFTDRVPTCRVVRGLCLRLEPLARMDVPVERGLCWLALFDVLGAVRA